MRGIEGKIGAIRYAREHQIPILGVCLGLQCMVIEVARDLAGITAANSAEFDPATPDPVVATMADQEDVVAGDRDMGGTMRLGLLPGEPGAEARSSARLYGDAAQVEERHRHRYEVNNAYRERLEAGRPGVLRPVARTAAWSSSSSCPARRTRSSSPPRPTRSSCPAPPGRTRCSPASSPPRSPAQGPHEAALPRAAAERRSWP